MATDTILFFLDKDEVLPVPLRGRPMGPGRDAERVLD